VHSNKDRQIGIVGGLPLEAKETENAMRTMREIGTSYFFASHFTQLSYFMVARISDHAFLNIHGAGTFSGTISAPRVNLPPLTATMVTLFCGTWLPLR
jgi:hypothetical protein